MGRAKQAKEVRDITVEVLGTILVEKIPGEGVEKRKKAKSKAIDCKVSGGDSYTVEGKVRVSGLNASIPKVDGVQKGVVCGISLEFCPSGDDDLVITSDDVKSERLYWKSALIGYMLGDKVHSLLWKGLFVVNEKGLLHPKVHLRSNGYFIFYFTNVMV
ncbi:hypothetical protein Droror1_Dr00024545 [Drosera rotundifolia]